MKQITFIILAVFSLVFVKTQAQEVSLNLPTLPESSDNFSTLKIEKDAQLEFDINQIFTDAESKKNVIIENFTNSLQTDEGVSKGFRSKKDAKNCLQNYADKLDKLVESTKDKCNQKLERYEETFFHGKNNLNTSQNKKLIKESRKSNLTEIKKKIAELEKTKELIKNLSIVEINGRLFITDK